MPSNDMEEQAQIQNEQEGSNTQLIANEAVGQRLRQIRKAKGLNQREVADLFKLVLGQPTISAYEAGRKRLGKHGMQMYVALMGANSEYIKTGRGEMFAPPKRGEYTKEAVVDALSQKSSGNLQFVGPRDVGRWVSAGFAYRVPYHLLPGNCFSFPITDFDLGSDYPFGAQLICTPFGMDGLLAGRVYVFQTNDRLITRVYSGLTELKGAIHYRLTSAYGPEIELKRSEVVQVYHVERIDKPVG